MKIKSILCLLFLAFGIFAQQKELTLSDAVMKQYRDFYPDRVIGFQWIPKTNAFSFIQDKKLMRSEVGKDTTQIISLEDLDTSAEVNFRSLGSYEWKSKNELLFNNGKTFVSYNVKTKTYKRWTLDDNAANALMNWKTKNFAFTVENNVFLLQGGNVKQLTHYADKDIVAGQFIARNEFGINSGLFWSENGKYLAFYVKDQREVYDYPLLDIDTIPAQLKLIKYPMAGQKSEKPSVGIYNVETGNLVYIHPSGNPDDYLTNVAFSKDEKYLLIAELNRDQNEMHLNLFDAETGKFLKTMTEETNENWVEPYFPPYFVSKTDFIWISEKDGFHNLYLYNTKKGFVRQLTNNQFELKNIIGSSSNGDTVYFTATGPEAVNTLVYAVDMKGNQTLLTCDDGTHSVSVSDNGKYFFDQYSSITVPNYAGIYSEPSVEALHLLTASNKLTDYKIGKTRVEKVKINGVDEYTRIIYPSDFDSTKKYPVLVYVYGGPHVQLITNSWYAGASLWMNWMAEQGYIIFTVDSRGSGNRGFAFESVIHRELGKNEMADQIAALNWLKQKPYIDAKRIAVHGWSFGGFMTTDLMLSYPGTFTTAVAGGPVTDWRMYEVMYGERYMDTPQENPEGYKKTNLSNKVNSLKGKLLLIHGSIDPVVVPQHNARLIEAFVKAKKQVDDFIYPMHEHNVLGIDRVNLMEKVLNYILENNK